jgi:hypothetical protein
LKCNEKAAKALRLFLAERGEATNFEEMDAQNLNRILKTFYFDARTVTGAMYKASSLENVRHSLNRYLKQPPHNRNIDIINNHSIRVTGASILSQASYNPHQIMVVTGHKSVQSLTVYERVTPQEKIRMGHTMTQVLAPQKEPLQLPQNVHMDDANIALDFDMDEFLTTETVTSSQAVAVQSNSSSTVTTVHKYTESRTQLSRGPLMPGVFNKSNCVIHNYITVNTIDTTKK